MGRYLSCTAQGKDFELILTAMHTKIGNAHFSRSGDMTAVVEIKNALRDPDHAHFRGGLSS